jgi:L-lactate dehydrogenase complex protein LldF
VLAHPTIYRAAAATGDEVLRHLPHAVLANRFNSWTNRGREMPEVPRQTFHSWWYENRVKKTGAKL